MHIYWKKECLTAALHTSYTFKGVIDKAMLQRIHLALSVSAANLILYDENNLLTFFSLWREIYLLYALIKTLTVCFL